MAGRKELGFPNTSAASLREQAARLTLRDVRAQGHPYVELRQDGKRFIFFCTLCLAPCYSDQVLFDHLKGNLHTRRYATAKDTLLASNPWPFNDGVHFFDNSHEENEQLTVVNANQNRLLDTHDSNDNLAIVKHSANGDENLDAEGLDVNSEVNAGDKNLNNDGTDILIVVPGVLLKDEITNLGLKYIGLGQIGARFREKDGVSNEIVRIWCEWLGDKSIADEDTFPVPEHDFAVINFKNYHELGMMSFADDLKALLCSGSVDEIENDEGSGRKRKMSFSDPEDVSINLTKRYGSSREGSVDSIIPSPRLLLDHEYLQKKFISSKSVRRELRRQQRVAAEKMCDICQHKMLPGKDVATILNMTTERLACSSRNPSGAFHVFHTSCLIHWILLCEYEILTNKPVGPKERQKPRRKNAGKCDKMEKVGEVVPTGVQTHIRSVFCPECHGTGINTEGDKLENTKYLQSQMFKYKINASEAHRAWMKSPEVLQNCSTGFYFPPQSEETAQEKVSHLKLLHFYGADA